MPTETALAAHKLPNVLVPTEHVASFTPIGCKTPQSFNMCDTAHRVVARMWRQRPTKGNPKCPAVVVEELYYEKDGQIPQ